MQTVWMETEADRLRREREEVAEPIRAKVAQTLRRCEERRAREERRNRHLDELKEGFLWLLEDIMTLPKGVQALIGGMMGALNMCVLLTLKEWVVFWFEKIALH